ncbi:hypothetical protein E4U58_002574 [Claviceps cyperi]|nr:hypothetical protein E4U58_002574 [Claviceps cyperi]
MRVSAAILSALVALSAALSFRDVHSQEDISSNEDLKIRGQSFLEYCPDKKTDEFLKIESIHLTPNLPVAGKDLSIEANLFLTRTIEKGSYFYLTVNYGLVRLLVTKADLCQQIGGFRKVDFRCPYKPGSGTMFITKTLALPKEMPLGTYTITADVFSVSHRPITCLTATVKFDVNSLGEPDDD